MLSANELILIVIILSALWLIISNRLRVDIVALLVLGALYLTGLVTTQEAIAGFSSSAVIVIMGMFVITHALEETSIISYITLFIQRVGRHSESRLTLLIMSISALMVLVMNIIAAGATLLPAVVRVAREANIRPSKLLIPMSYATMLGAMASYFASANIIMSTLLQERGFVALGFLDFFITGLPIFFAGVAYMMFIGRRLLPERESVGQIANPAGISRNIRETYQLDDRMWEILVPPTSSLVNTTLSHSRIGSQLGITVVAIWRGHRAILAPEPIEVINANDYLLVMGREDRVRGLESRGLKVGRENGGRMNGHDYSVDLTEVIIPPRSNAIGKTLVDLGFRNKYGLTSVALWREGHSYRTDVGKTPLQVGDALLMVGPVTKIKRLASERDYMLLQSSHIYQPPHPQKAKWALLLIAFVLVAAITGVIALPVAVLLAWVGVIVSGIMSMDDAYRAVEWRVVFLIGGMLAIGPAMIHTGLADRLGSALVYYVEPFGPMALLGGMYILAMLTAQFIGGQVTPLVMGPVALTAAVQAGVDPRAMAITVAIGCISGFLTPLAHPVNILMMGPGGYVFADFPRVGIGLTIVTFLMLMLMMRVLWGIA